MTDTIQVGQRWVSLTEPELGLGTVQAVTPRTITLRFAASGDTRQYVRDSAPLRRATFRRGDTIATSDRRSLTIDEVVEEDGLVCYTCDGVRVPETELSHTLSFDNPIARLFAGHFDPAAAFDLRRQALSHQHRTRASAVRGLQGGRIDLLPHQLSIAADVTARMLPRVLLADEVGLGKTIEAGLIVHRLLLTGRVDRVLILVPPTLVHQWFVEMLRRFNLWFSIYDEERCAAIHAGRPDANPFLDSQLVIASLDLLASAPARLQQALDAGWDAVVVDEAHHLAWTPDAASAEYRAVEALGRRTPSLLLLTATPEQLGLDSHFARLHLLDPDRFHDREAFTRETAEYGRLATIADKLRVPGRLSAVDRALLRQWLRLTDPDLDAMLSRIEAGDEDVASVCLNVLLDRHGTGRVMFRNTRATVSGFPQRVAHLYPLDSENDGQDCARALRREWLCDTGVQPEVRQPNFRSDSRATWLFSLLRSLAPEEKVLVLCRSQLKAVAIETALKEHSAVLPMASFHEAMTLVQRDRAAAWFAEPGGARVLVCSEIGSEGRNFQFAHHLVLFDLPLDPSVLEQRIGRLDRIGQRADVHVHVPYVQGTHQEVLARWYHDGLDAFATPTPGGRELLELFGHRTRLLADLRQDSHRDTDAELLDLIEATRRAQRALSERLEQGRDRLLEWNSCRPSVAARLIDDIRRQDSVRELDDFLLRTLDLFMIAVEELAPRTYRLGSAGVLVDDFPGLTADGLTLTADRARAVVREDLQFLTWDHPIVTGALDLLLGSEKGNCSFRFVSAGTGPALYLDVLYVLECLAPGQLHADRFLPPTPIRIFVDHHGREHPVETVPSEPLQPVDRRRVVDGRALVSQARIRDVVLPAMIRRAAEAAERRAADIIARARLQMHVQLTAEVERLRALQAVNPSVREEEVESLVVQQTALTEHIDASRLRLDAVQLLHTSPDPPPSSDDATRPVPQNHRRA